MSSDRPTDAESPTRPAANWRGKGNAAATSRVRRWQRESTAGTPAASRSGSRIPTRYRIAIALLAVCALVGWYLGLILQRPVQTPIILLTASTYSVPMSPNAWAEEDARGLMALDGQTLQVFNAINAATTREATRQALRLHLKSAAKRHSEVPLIVYLNMHAATDGEGRPCLIPSESSPNDSATWLPVSEVFDAIEEHKHSLRGGVVVVFDTCRIDSNWSAGIVRSTFIERLVEFVEGPDGPLSRIPQLAVVTSAGPGEVSHISEAQQRSIFGQFLLASLVGNRADTKIDLDGNFRVSLREMCSYLSQEVDAWSRRNRGSPQKPMLLSAAETNFSVAWASRSFRSRAEEFSPTVEESEIASLWQRAEKLNRYRPLRQNPLAWASIQRSLVYLEAASAAGRGYGSVARSIADQVAASLARYERQANEATDDRLSTFRDAGEPSLKMPAHSYALRWALTAPVSEASPSYVGLFEEATPTTISNVANRLEEQGGTDAPINEVHFLRLLERSPGFRNASQQELDRILSLHILAEQAASPSDERTWPAIRTLVLRGDSARREIEDLFFAGESFPSESLTSARSAYETAIQIASDLAEAYRIRDQVRNDSVHLAEWLTDRRRPLARPEDADRGVDLVNTVLLPLIEATNQLDLELPTVTEESVPRVRMHAESVRKEYARLRDIFDQSYLTALDPGRNDVGTLRLIDTLLAIPLLPSQAQNETSPAALRGKLLERRSRIAAELAQRSAEAKSTVSEPSSAEDVAADDSRWRRHPLHELAFGSLPAQSGPAPSSNVASDAERLGEQIREWLEELPLLVNGTPEQSNSDENDLNDLLRSAARARRAAPLWVSPPGLDPIKIGRENLLANLLLAQAERTLDDFWGPAESLRAPFFELVAADYLEAAKEAIDGSRSSRFENRVRAVEELVQSRRLAAAKGLMLTSSNLIRLDTQKTETTQIMVRPTSDLAGSMPAGRAAIGLQFANRWISDAGSALPLPPPSEGATAYLPVDMEEIADSNTDLKEAVLFYRGNSFKTRLIAESPQGPLVVVQTAPSTPTSLTLFSDREKPLSVVIVLDCSASMAGSATIEGTGSSPTRLELARVALSRLLAELSERPGTRVGVVFYGHRVGWRSTTDEKGQKRFQRSVQLDYARSVDDAVMAFDDVEVVEPLGRFDGAVAGEVDALLSSLRPWGETPLYLAITVGLAQFSADDAASERALIVITDGLNDQSNPTAEAVRTSGDVLAASRAVQVPIDIIGFGIESSVAERASREFSSLAELSGGEYSEVKDASVLLRTLLQRLGPATYSVTSPGSRSSQTIDLGTSFPLTTTPGDYRVDLEADSEQIYVEGGEAVVLNAGPSGDILSGQYTAGGPRFLPLVSGDPPQRTNVQLGIHRIVVSDNGANFELSLQRADQRFLTRPILVWADVTPISEEGTSFAPYVFYDRQFVSGTPVPVVRWTAANWPRQTKQAQMRFWCSFDPVTPVGRINVSDLLAEPGMTVRVQDLSGVTFEAYRSMIGPEEVRLDVIERHDPSASDLGNLAVLWAGTARPKELNHRFDYDHGIGIHRYTFSTSDSDLIPKGELVIQQREEKGNWIRLQVPTTVNVFDSADVLTPFRVPEIAAPLVPDSSESSPSLAPQN